MAKFLGLILLAAAIAAALYLATNADNLTGSKFVIPIFKLPSINLPDFPSSVPNGGGTSAGETSIETQKPVNISSVRNTGGFAEVKLSANLLQGETADISGWTVKSNKGLFTIPKAQEIYSFGGMQGDIKLRSGDLVNFYAGLGPKGNFRLNKCMGYIEDLTPFNPSLPKECPYISRLEVQEFSGDCQDYLLSLDVCENPSANPPVPLDDNACHEFLRKLNYVGCVEKYRWDSDFLSRDWMVWMGDQINISDFNHDKIQLLDKSGKLVDEYIY